MERSTFEGTDVVFFQTLLILSGRDIGFPRVLATSILLVGCNAEAVEYDTLNLPNEKSSLCALL